MGVDIGFRSVYLFHTYCIHSCILASPTSCSTCQVLPHFKRRGYKTPFAFPQLNSELLIRLFMNNTRNKCKTLGSRILQPPLIQFSIYTSACSACQVVPCSRRQGVNILSCCFFQHVFFLEIHGRSVKHVVNGKYYVTTN